MKTILSLAAAFCVLACSTANASRIAVTTNGNIASVFIKGDALDNNFDTVDFAFTPAAGVQLLNITSGAGPRPAGDPFTYRNRALDADPLDGGLGWSIVGQSINAQGVSWAGSPLGMKIDTGDDNGPGLFMSNLNFSVPATKEAGTGRIQLISAGIIVYEAPIVIPEPASFGLVGVALAGLAGLRRRLA